MQDKVLLRLEAKIDALLEKSGLKPKDFADASPAPRPAPKLTAEEQQAIDNAPKTPVGANGPVGTGPRVEPTTNAPSTAASVPESKGKR